MTSLSTRSTPVRTDPARLTPAQYRSRKRRANRAGYIVSAVLITVALITTLLPLYFIFAASFNPTGSLGSLLPTGFTLNHYTELFTTANLPYPLWFWNSVRVAVLVTFLTTLTVSMSAYAFSRLRFKGRDGLLQTIVLLQVFPNLLAIVALFLIVQQMGDTISEELGLNSLWALILVYIGGAIGGNVWLLKGYLDSIPKELDESATIDGATHWVIFTRILLPLMRPMLAVVAVLTFVGAYGEVLVVQVLIRDPQEFTLPLGIYTMSVQQFTVNFGLFAAGSVIAALPPLILFYSLQKWLISGLTQGAVKS